MEGCIALLAKCVGSELEHVLDYILYNSSRRMKAIFTHNEMCYHGPSCLKARTGI